MLTLREPTSVTTRTKYFEIFRNYATLMLINFFDERDTFVKIDKLRNKLTKEIYEETCEELTECLIDIDLVH